MPFLSGWNYRKAIKYGSTKPGANLTAFSLVIKIAGDTDIGAVLSARKFAITGSDGVTTTPYGNYNNFALSGGACTFTLRAKFNLSSSAATGDVIGYLYYDDTQTDTADRTGCLDSNYQFFMPQSEDPTGSAPQELDWSTNGLNGTCYDTTVLQLDSLNGPQSANCLKFSGSYSLPHGVESAASSAPSLTDNFTVEGWSKGIQGNTGTLVNHGGTDPQSGYRIDSGSSKFVAVYRSAGNYEDSFSSDSAIGDSNWHYVALVFNSGASNYVTMYVDGTEQTAHGTRGPANGGSVVTTTRNASTNSFSPWTSPSAEIAVASSPRSASWIAYAYQNMANNSATVTLGTQEVPAAGGGVWLWRA